jgi:hypothetical protein
LLPSLIHGMAPFTHTSIGGDDRHGTAPLRVAVNGRARSPSA